MGCPTVYGQLLQRHLNRRQVKMAIFSYFEKLLKIKIFILEDKIAAAKGDYNFDHPNAFDWDLMHEVLSKIRDGKPVDVPHYCFVQHKRIPGTVFNQLLGI